MRGRPRVGEPPMSCRCASVWAVGCSDLRARRHELAPYYDMQCRFGGRFWARMPQGESRFDVAKRIHQAFGTFHRDALEHGIHDIVVICHGVTLRAFVMMWCHLSPEWFAAEANPNNCAVRLIEGGADKGYVFGGFPRRLAWRSRASPGDGIDDPVTRGRFRGEGVLRSEPHERLSLQPSIHERPRMGVAGWQPMARRHHAVRRHPAR